MSDGTTDRLTRRRALAGATAAGLGAGALAFPGVAAAATAAQYNVQSSPYEARGDGTTDDARAIQEAIDAANRAGGGTVYFPAGTYVVGRTLTLYSRIYLVGAGMDASKLKLKDSVNTDLVKSYRYDELIGTGEYRGANAGIEFAGLVDVTLDGNSQRNTSGTGLKHYGRCLVIRNATIRYCAEKGISSERGIGGEQMEAHVSGLFVRDCGSDGIDWRGPHDSTFVNVHVIRCAGEGIRVRGGSGSVEPGYGGAGTMFLNSHVWGGGTKAWTLEQGAFLTQCTGEGASESQLHVKASGCVVIGGNYFANNFGSYGIKFGETGVAPRRSLIATRCGQATVADAYFVEDGGNGSIELVIEEGSGTAYRNVPHWSTRFALTVQGAEGGYGELPYIWNRATYTGIARMEELRAIRGEEGAEVFRTNEAGRIGFHAATPIAKPTVTGSRGGNAALASLLTALAQYGLITNSTSA